MSGVRVVEVAQFTFVPAAGAVMADWGADVIKVEHARTGDAQRGLMKVFGLDAISKGSSFHPMMEGPNRGKRSIGLALEKAEARELLYEIVRTSDVFLTNFLPEARQKLGIDLEDIRKINPDIIYVRGSGFGPSGPESNKGGFDSTGFWARGGSGAQINESTEFFLDQPTGAYGDSIGGMTIAGGIAAALFKRATTGETSVVDVSLLSVGAWTTQFSVNMALMVGGPVPSRPPRKYGSASNPLTGPYQTSDGRWIMLAMLQPGRYWADFMTAAGRSDLATDERFDTGEKVLANAAEASDVVAELFATKTYAEMTAALESQEGQWAAVQNTWEVGNDISLRANGMVAKVEDAEGVERELIANPVQFDMTPVSITRAPQFAEHTDDIVRELGHDDERLIELKLLNAIT
ncbi:CaiB/BaiF CoA transferase family protein [Nocardioides sp. Iso805N]|uniref:CaiB/BaiF CoA transferase family protein n=1 Tax=Nocardioides sp. Iso805N TaxID=1283287 RepID=UPI0018DEDE19|nr:CoA transferase [Nocardioides sp. Iso805N]